MKILATNTTNYEYRGYLIDYNTDTQEFFVYCDEIDSTIDGFGEIEDCYSCIDKYLDGEYNSQLNHSAPSSLSDIKQSDVFQHKYVYDGPVYEGQNTQRLCNWTAETSATSKKKALSNLRYRAPTELRKQVNRHAIRPCRLDIRYLEDLGAQ